jgi:hypothetical protein
MLGNLPSRLVQLFAHRSGTAAGTNNKPYRTLSAVIACCTCPKRRTARKTSDI